MAIVFDGRAEAKKIEDNLSEKVKKLKDKPAMVSVLVGDDAASVLYTSLKQKAAIRVGVEFLIEKLPDNTTLESIKEIIRKFNNDDKIQGVMIQLPLPQKLNKHTKEIIQEIEPTKDVDGLRADSKFVPATVKAIMKVIDICDFQKIKTIVVVGEQGAVGGRLIKILKDNNYKVTGVEKISKNWKEIVKSGDLIISATGQENLIKKDMIKDGVALIDVGAPKGDIHAASHKKASFYTPVPGGIGPMTIACLLENVVSRASSN
jgi:methylenetetrahydrofolate dehydrogenase (NADP+) / methenyltetrahydrofolate cyclohydrolase